MEFNPTEDTDLNYSLLKFVSHEGKWEMGVHPVIYGVRVRANRVGDMWCPLDICAGDSYVDMMRILDLTKRFLFPLPEDIDPNTVFEYQPRYEIRPIWKNPGWEKTFEEAIERISSRSFAVY